MFLCRSGLRIITTGASATALSEHSIISIIGAALVQGWVDRTFALSSASQAQYFCRLGVTAKHHWRSTSTELPRWHHPGHHACGDLRRLIVDGIFLLQMTSPRFVDSGTSGVLVVRGRGTSAQPAKTRRATWSRSSGPAGARQPLAQRVPRSSHAILWAIGSLECAPEPLKNTDLRCKPC